MAVTDILQLTDDGDPVVYAVPTFTVNVAVTEVNVNFAAVPDFFWGVFSTPSGLNIFEPQDNLIVQSMTLQLPYCFGLGSLPSWWGLAWKDAGTTTGYAVPEWSTDGRQFMPVTNVEIPLDVYLPHNPLLGPPFQPGQLCVGIADFTISMIGVPAALDSLELPIQIALKVEHNFDLT